MPHDHILPPQPELGCYVIREVHQGRADGVLMAYTQEEEACILSAAAILAVQGYACRLLRMADEARFAAQPQAYREKLLPAGLPLLSPDPGESPAGLAARMAACLRPGR